MVPLAEIFHCQTVHLFRWNEEILRQKIADSQGIALFHIASCYRMFRMPRTGHIDEIESIHEVRQIVVNFNLSELLAKDHNLGPNLVRETKQFLPQTDENLGREISNYLFTHFQFDPETILKPNSPKTVIVIDVLRILKLLLDNVVLDNGEDCKVSQIFPPSRTLEDVDEHEDDEVLSLDNIEDSNITISQILHPGRTLENVDEHEDDENENEDDDYEDNLSLNNLKYLLGLRSYFNVRRRGRPLTRVESRGFVEISPVVLKKRNEFDKRVHTCAICLDGFVDVDDDKILTTKCLHAFHSYCISKWLYNKNSCPTCRLVLPLSDIYLFSTTK
ncbi:hypothetical protein ACH5RR_006559 [Cinchona calisaya]|uniref:RING-type domain-containing protein n=1 Tax=Cinchona calisaya TaxID=153742 RepID=A0ABD3APD0_9GENT